MDKSHKYSRHPDKVYRAQINELVLNIWHYRNYTLQLADINWVVYLGICKYAPILDLEHELVNLFDPLKQAVQVNPLTLFGEFTSKPCTCIKA